MLLGLLGSSSAAQDAPRHAHIGYLYPAGGARGETVRIMVGGQYLRGANGVRVTGEGVQGSVVIHAPPARPLDGPQRRALWLEVREIMTVRLAEMGLGQVDPAALVQGVPSWTLLPRRAKEPEAEPLPDLPLLADLDARSLDELREIVRRFIAPINPLQRQPAIAEIALVDVAIAANAEPGPRELRLVGPGAASNPLRFEVDALPEVREWELNDQAATVLPARETPFVLNGQILPGDVDRFRFRARKGRRLVLEAHARSLIPYMADAVPGWFQATLAVYDGSGKEVAYADDYRFSPDPVLLFEAPETGEYELEVRDSIYRGREDFVYRISVSERPFITGLFPLGGPIGDPVRASVSGWNLVESALDLNADAGGPAVRQTVWTRAEMRSNAVVYAVDTLPECEESEPNDDPSHAQPVSLSTIVNGRIGVEGDVDVFEFRAEAGQEIVAEVVARRLNSPLDSLLRVTDAAGAIVAWNDDQDDPASGLLTHHADSYVRIAVADGGTYRVSVSDAQGQGGGAYAYRLRLSPPRPDFALRAAPSAVLAPAGLAAPFTVHAIRKDGFDGDIEVTLAGDSGDFVLDGGVVPAGKDKIRMTLTAPGQASAAPAALHLEGRAVIGGATVVREVAPAEDMMQAFLWRHLVPVQEFLAITMGARRTEPAPVLESDAPVRIPAGGETTVRIALPGRGNVPTVDLELDDPPAGLSLGEIGGGRDEVTLVLQADAASAPVGFRDNLIVNVYITITPRAREGETPKPVRVRACVLPAIPIEVVAH